MTTGRIKRLIGAVLALLITGAPLAIFAPTISIHAADRSTAVNVANTASNTPKSVKIVGNAVPTWKELNAAQQHALAPLASDWDKLKPTTKKKWLEISGRYATMTPAEQERIQARMHDWVTLTSEQRRIARENYARANKLDTEQRALRWQQYQQLSDQQKKELVEQATPRHKRITTMPPTTLSKSKPAAPVKLTPRPASGETAPNTPAAPALAPTAK